MGKSCRIKFLLIVQKLFRACPRSYLIALYKQGNFLELKPFLKRNLGSNSSSSLISCIQARTCCITTTISFNAESKAFVSVVKNCTWSIFSFYPRARYRIAWPIHIGERERARYRNVKLLQKIVKWWKYCYLFQNWQEETGVWKSALYFLAPKSWLSHYPLIHILLRSLLHQLVPGGYSHLLWNSLESQDFDKVIILPDHQFRQQVYQYYEKWTFFWSGYF